MNHIKLEHSTISYNPISYIPMEEVKFRNSFKIALENKGIAKLVIIDKMVYGFVLGGVLYMNPNESDKIKSEIINQSMLFI
jgi:hypothetical protein